jgi:CBS domain-containing protein/gamma-glutamyl:cysteine ligase YbdK (ATP-grasp superfamily)
VGFQTATGLQDRRVAIRWMLQDLRALEQMLEDRAFESGVHRIGAEQEMFLVDASWQPAPGALDVLAAITDTHFTTEVGAFNLELNLDPQEFTGDCLSLVQAQLEELLAIGRACANAAGLEVVLAGILPTIRKGDLRMENMVPNPRYLALNRALMDLRGEDYELHIKGTDELRVRQDSVMAEACNASFQVHLQVSQDEFANLYNIAQLLAGPVLACATNSPLLFGKRLWAETRIALFEQSVDVRRPGPHMRERSPRVTFGSGWVQESVAELYREDISRHRPVLAPDDYDDPFEAMAEGRVPDLEALRLHTGTVWRWNRACYGVGGGVPHLRIENRVLPSGPTVTDEVANAALWLGLMRAVGTKHHDVSRLLEFEQARANLVAAARQGLGAQLTWLDGEERSAASLALDHLLPLAADGLDEVGVSAHDRDRYLEVVERRVRSGHTGSRWLLSSLAGLRAQGTEGQRLNSVTAAMVARQKGGAPVAEWTAASIDEGGGWRHNFLTIEQLMTTDLVTVTADDPVELAANLMDWHRIRQVLVEDAGHQLVGLVSYRTILRLLARGTSREGLGEVLVGDVMRRDPVCVPPDVAPLRALEIMRSFGIGALPVVQDGHLVGLITEHDFMNVAGVLLLQQLSEPHHS